MTHGCETNCPSRKAACPAVMSHQLDDYAIVSRRTPGRRASAPPPKADSGMRTVFWTILGTARSGGPTKPGGKNSAAEELLTSWVDEFPSPSVKTTDRSCGPAFLGSSKF